MSDIQECINMLSQRISAALGIPAKYLFGETLFDGLTADECFSRYLSNQREETRHELTALQMTAAQVEWRKAMSGLAKAEEQRQQRQITCQDQYDIDA